MALIESDSNTLFAEFLDIPLPARGEQPRERGLTMVMDQGLPVEFLDGMLAGYGQYLDIAKLWDPCLRTPMREIERRVETYKSHGVRVQPGGILLEMARALGKEHETLKRVRELGFDLIEISSTTSTRDGEGSDSDRLLLEEALGLGFDVVGEVGRKFPDGDETRISDRVIDIEQTIAEFQDLLANGAWKVYWEGHLLRRVLGDNPRRIKEQSATGLRQVKEVVAAVGLDNIIFEASGLRPRANRQWLQFWLVQLFGPDVNIGNARIEELANLEAIRMGTHPIFGFGSGGNYSLMETLSKAKS